MNPPTDFWSRRKAAVRSEAEAEERQFQQLKEQEEQKALEERPDEDILEELGLPDPDTMGQGDDFSRFMKAAVPERIRRRALRKLWLSNPVLANLDGLLEYGEDYTDAATVVEDLSTAYEIGKGMLARFATEGEVDTEDPQPNNDLTETVTVSPEVPEPKAASGQLTVEQDPAEDTDDAMDFAPVTKRRMQFRFDDN